MLVCESKIDRAPRDNTTLIDVAFLASFPPQTAQLRAEIKPSLSNSCLHKIHFIAHHNQIENKNKIIPFFTNNEYRSLR